MDHLFAWVFVGVAAAGVALALLALVHLGIDRLESGLGRQNDGLPPGRPAPHWRLPDSDGVVHSVPSGTCWQALVFANHSLAAFPRLVDGLRRFSSPAQPAELLGLSVDGDAFAEPALRALELTYPLISVAQGIYDEYNVYAMPFVTIVDPSGVVRASGLVNDDADLAHVWRVARIGAQTPLKEAA